MLRPVVQRVTGNVVENGFKGLAVPDQWLSVKHASRVIAPYWKALGLPPFAIVPRDFSAVDRFGVQVKYEYGRVHFRRYPMGLNTK
jgi:hypothetical protein